ncbi:hypothetical protein SAMN04487910_0045 [Aquimarina amphilecti]|uniref:Uncharacterized protein n=1 Tax=Aquimarina amphilecti TaxID=1038014 RepID=A0A1H7FKL7_AQUAM|nr:hypothetical protein [Aquimarina amphilecti]SEK23865.1 hypothetical protein SAMN04487910_0045 [Aquimarina amphilecti]
MNTDKLLEKDIVSHDELIEGIFVEYKKADKIKYTSAFLSSLSSDHLSFRSGLPVFAILQSFPKHKFKLVKNQKPSRISPCDFCSSYEQIELDTELVEESFEEIGGLTGFDLLDYFYYLKKTNELKSIKPKKEDYKIFLEILEILENANNKDTVKKELQKKISKIKGFKSDSEQRQALLETLGYCSILETEEHKGLLNQYTNLAIAPTKTHSSDWNYPVDWWLGKDGINKKAFKFWFGDYPELEKYCI